MVPDLRPRGIGEILDSAVALYRARFTKLALVAAGYRVYFKKHPLEGGTYGMDHSSVIFLMGPDGKFVTYWDDTAIGPDKLAEELRERT